MVTWNFFKWSTHLLISIITNIIQTFEDIETKYLNILKCVCLLDQIEKSIANIETLHSILKKIPSSLKKVHYTQVWLYVLVP